LENKGFCGSTTTLNRAFALRLVYPYDFAAWLVTKAALTWKDGGSILKYKEGIAMGISTGRGDDGRTEIAAGKSVPKDHPRVEFVGVLDELNSFLGDAKAAAAQEQTRAAIETVQKDLFLAPLLLDSPESEPAPGGKMLPQGGGIDPERLAALTRSLEEKHPMRGFIIPGKNAASAKLDIARTVCRRAERRLITLDRQEPVPALLRRYLNRLSDLLFMLARSEEDDNE
jgi:cob(I)alamin adenosyltransferase